MTARPIATCSRRSTWPRGWDRRRRGTLGSRQRLSERLDSFGPGGRWRGGWRSSSPRRTRLVRSAPAFLGLVAVAGPNLPTTMPAATLARWRLPPSTHRRPASASVAITVSPAPVTSATSRAVAPRAFDLSRRAATSLLTSCDQHLLHPARSRNAAASYVCVRANPQMCRRLRLVVVRGDEWCGRSSRGGIFGSTSTNPALVRDSDERRDQPSRHRPFQIVRHDDCACTGRE